MRTLVMAALAGGVGLGVLLVVQGWRGREVLPGRDALVPDGTSTTVATAWAAGALASGLVVVAVTGWAGAGLGTLCLVAALPRFLGGSGRSASEIAKTQAIASWAEMIRDNMAGAAGLEQALIATADIAPEPIAGEVREFTARLDTTSPAEALAVLGDALDHPSADLVVVSLANAARMEGRDLGPLLGRLAEAIRGDVRMRHRIEVGRARIRTSARIVLAVTLLTVALVYSTSRPLVGVYASFVGQLWLGGIFALFIVALWLMDRYARVRLPERFSARRTDARIDVGVLR